MCRPISGLGLEYPLVSRVGIKSFALGPTPNFVASFSIPRSVWTRFSRWEMASASSRFPSTTVGAWKDEKKNFYQMTVAKTTCTWPMKVIFFSDWLYLNSRKEDRACSHIPETAHYKLTTNEVLRAFAASERIPVSSSFFFIDRSLSFVTLASSFSKASLFSVVVYQTNHKK